MTRKALLGAHSQKRNHIKLPQTELEHTNSGSRVGKMGYAETEDSLHHPARLGRLEFILAFGTAGTVACNLFLTTLHVGDVILCSSFHPC
jgi:hypothetical protein